MSPEVFGIASALSRFLQYCGHQLKTTNRHFEVDGIQVDLGVEVEARGIEDIRSLAAELGIRDVQKIYAGPYGLPVSPLIILVQSRPIQEGDRIAQSQLTLTQKFWKDWRSDRVEPDDELLTRGLWQTSGENLHSMDRWIVRDGDWSIEVGLGAGVPYEDALRIIRAIRAGKLVDVRQGPSWTYLPLSVKPEDLKQFSETDLPRIQRANTAPPGDSGRYEIDIPEGGSGTTLEVRIVGDGLEVLSVGRWIV